MVYGTGMSGIEEEASTTAFWKVGLSSRAFIFYWVDQQLNTQSVKNNIITFQSQVANPLCVVASLAAYSAGISWLNKESWTGGDVESASHFHPAGAFLPSRTSSRLFIFEQLGNPKFLYHFRKVSIVHQSTSQLRRGVRLRSFLQSIAGLIS